MAATSPRTTDLSQLLKKVIDELNGHPNARLFFTMQEHGVRDADSVGGSKTEAAKKLTLKTVVDRISSFYYTSITSFTDDMSSIFSDCESDTSLASGVASVRMLFNDSLARFSPHHAVSTPPGRKKRSRKDSFVIDAPFCLLKQDNEEFESNLGDFGDIFDSLDVEDLQSEHHAALVELTEQISLIEAEIQHLRDDSVVVPSWDNLSVNGGGSQLHSYPSALQSSYYAFGFASSQEEGRMTMNGQTAKKRSRRTSVRPLQSSASATKRRKTKSKKSLDDSAYIPYMSKEELLHTITHDLPAHFLEGVIKIVHPSFDPLTATDDDLEFDINLLDDDILQRLMKYVYGAIEGERQEGVPGGAVRRTRINDQKPRNGARREAPKERLRKEAPKRRRTTTPVVVPSSTQRQRKPSPNRKVQRGKQQSSQFGVLTSKKRSYMPSEIFRCEEVIHVSKCHDTEDEEVDILGI